MMERQRLLAQQIKINCCNKMIFFNHISQFAMMCSFFQYFTEIENGLEDRLHIFLRATIFKLLARMPNIKPNVG